MAQSSDFNTTQVVWNADFQYGGARYGWQFGSTAKAYALVTALERGMPLNSEIYAPQASPTKPYAFTKDQVIDDCGMDKPWEVENDYSVGGEMSLQKATSQSINTAFAALTLSLGGCSVRDTMTKMGLHSSDGQPIEGVISAITLGAGTTTPMTIASSYATLAARGVYCEPFPITSITTPDDKPIAIPQPPCSQVISPEVADGVNQLLEGPLKDGTAAGSWNWSRPAAGKTGTTNDHNQSWFVGYTPQLSTAVWIGNDDNSPLPGGAAGGFDLREVFPGDRWRLAHDFGGQRDLDRHAFVGMPVVVQAADAAVGRQARIGRDAGARDEQYAFGFE